MREKYFSTPPLRGGVRNSWFWRHRQRWWVDLACAFNLARSVGSWGLLLYGGAWILHFCSKNFPIFFWDLRRDLALPLPNTEKMWDTSKVYDASLVSRGLSMTSKLDLFVNLIIFTLFESISFSLLFSEMLSCQVTRKWFSTKLRKSFSHLECKNKGWCCALA